MDGGGRWRRWKRAESALLTAWYQRVTESYVATWLYGVFQSSRMSASTAAGGGGGGGSGGGGGVGGALTLMGCVREASPPPQSHHQHRTLAEYSTQNSVDPLPKGEIFYIDIYVLHMGLNSRLDGKYIWGNIVYIWGDRIFEA